MTGLRSAPLSLLLCFLASSAPARAATTSTPPAVPPAQEPAPPLTLARAVELGLARAHDQVAAELQVQIADQSVVTAKAAILPNVNFNASAGFVRSGGGAVIQTITNAQGQPQDLIQATDVRGSYSFSIGARQLLYDGGAWWNNLDAARSLFKSAEAAAAEQRLLTRFTVEQKFLELVRARRQLAVFGEAAARSRDQADFVQKLFDAGRAAQSDVYAARANRDNDEVNRLGSEARLELARFDLAISIGLDPQEPLAVVEPQDLLDEPRSPPDARAAVERALAQRPSLAAARHTIEANAKQVAAARGGYRPTVTANASYGRNASKVGDYVDPALDQKSTLSGSVTLSWNLFQGFSTDASVRTQELQLRLAENDLANGRRGVASDVEKAIASLGTARSQSRIAAQSEETAKQGLQLARTRQQVGLGTQLEVRDAELKLTQAQLSLVNALLDGREQESALRRAVGGDKVEGNP